LGAEIVVFLDDDEIVAPGFLGVATEHIGHQYDGEVVLGVAGLYEDSAGSLFLPQSELTGNIFLDKARSMNESTRVLIRGSRRLQPTPVAFGGNMVIHRNLFSQVGFDPNITRGEDLDFVLNARLAGFRFWLDRELRITHLPPRDYDMPPYVKLAEDVRRFVYEREKLRQAKERGLPIPSATELRPYPGRFFSADLCEQARAALVAVARPQQETAYGAPDEILKQAHERAHRLATAYFEFEKNWRLLMKTSGHLLSREEVAARLGWDFCWK
jgi:hypothetical protein